MVRKYRYRGNLCEWYEKKSNVKEIPYEIHYSLDYSSRLIENAMEVIEKYSRIVFVPRKSDQQCYLKIIKNYPGYCPEEDNGCFPIISLVNNQSKRFEVILHELMHSLGFHHEHSRPDRNLYLWIFWDNIDPDSLSQFRMLSYDDYQWNDFEMDYQSIMMYPSLSYSKNGHITIAGKDGQFICQNIRLSFLDKIKLSLL
ncbi:zinc metalloproteinase nas-8 [Trichonephila inaurata madagascariensis]|uniref:Metalloendopeptidase n=1 Tax=Trichonephila inaurata madagascariensis TaxID=2747483 RepID=A0A8X6YSY0_9ARAC|nr:zinc metalloproteinase nas-8 [Trichonephila inaurata madagascariensis]